MDRATFDYRGYKIPIDLINLTGGGVDDWDAISVGHVDLYRRYTPLHSDHVVLEVGCGVGRDAIQLVDILSERGRYIGFDIILPSIDWAQQNISTQYSNFEFVYFDVESQIHNPGGEIDSADVRLPAEDASVDRVFLHSVFTHMFAKGIVHYLKEFRRVLKPDGLVLASFFIVDEIALRMVRTTDGGKQHRHQLSFEHKREPGCFINDLKFPEGAVAYTPLKLKAMLFQGGLGIHGRHVHRGVWSGVQDASNGQDIIVLEQASTIERIVQLAEPLRFTGR